MSDQSRVFIGLLRPPKLMGLPIMYAMVWLFGSSLLFLWVQSGVVVDEAHERLPERLDHPRLVVGLRQQSPQGVLGEWDGLMPWHYVTLSKSMASMVSCSINSIF